MKKVGRKKISYSNPIELLGNPYRRNMLEHCYMGKIRSLKQVQKQFELSHRTSLYHINMLKKAGYIELKQDKHKAGKPIEITITKEGENVLAKVRPDFFKK